MAVVRIEGVEFELKDAHEFAERALIYGEDDPAPRLATQVGIQIELCVRTEGSFDVDLSGMKADASAILNEWPQSGDAPDAARTLSRALARR